MFRMKTRLRRAVAVLILLLAAVLFIIIRIHQKRLQPSSVVRQELDQIRTMNLDAQLGAYSGSGSDPQQEAELQSQAVGAFFSQFSYQIKSSRISGSQAEVLAEITNIDAAALAHDLRLLLTRRSADPFQEQTNLRSQDCYTLLLQALSTGTYDLVSTDVTIHLDKTNGSWQIRNDETLEDELLGGFYTRLKDPYLLDAREVLSVYLSFFSEFDKADWMRYLKLHDIFSTCSASYAQKLDEMYTARLSDCFACQIDSCETEGDKALAQLTVTSIDMAAVLKVYRESLLAYAGTTESITSDAAALSDATALYLLDALNKTDKSAQYPVQIHLQNNGQTWIPVFDEAVTAAFLGKIPEALESF